MNQSNETRNVPGADTSVKIGNRTFLVRPSKFGHGDAVIEILPLGLRSPVRNLTTRAAVLARAKQGTAQ